jgi:large subunit ribosomal protein L29
MTKASELRNLGDTDLVGRLAEAKEELFNLRFQNVTGQLDNPSRLGVVRKDIARLSTILREREIELHEDQARAAQSGEVNANG